MTDQVSPITMSLMGGLGNQLFQLATGLEISQRSGAPLELDLSWFGQGFRRKTGGLILRPYDLNGIADDIPKSTVPAGRFGSLARWAQDAASSRASGLMGRLPLRTHYETGGGFDPVALQVRAGTRLRGYFSSWRYFPSSAADVRRRVLQAPTRSPEALLGAPRGPGGAFVALHVRRGDYLTLSATYGHVAPDYYRRAVGLLRDLGHRDPIWLFSDDPPGARAFLEGAVAIDHVVEPPSNSPAVESLVLMSAAKALVIANSTYSWWAAFLREAPTRPVIAPRPLWGDSNMSDGRDWLLPDWLTVDCRTFD